jgi:hypothetical protein
MNNALATATRQRNSIRLIVRMLFRLTNNTSSTLDAPEEGPRFEAQLTKVSLQHVASRV